LDAKVNEKKRLLALVDSGASHNFMREEVAKELGLKLEPGERMFKSVNIDVEKVIGHV